MPTEPVVPPVIPADASTSPIDARLAENSASARPVAQLEPDAQRDVDALNRSINTGAEEERAMAERKQAVKEQRFSRLTNQELNTLASKMDAAAAAKSFKRAINEVGEGVDKFLEGVFGKNGATTLRMLIRGTIGILKWPAAKASGHFEKQFNEILDGKNLRIPEEQKDQIRSNFRAALKDIAGKEYAYKSASSGTDYEDRVHNEFATKAEEEASYAFDTDATGPDAQVEGVVGNGRNTGGGRSV